MKVAELLEMQKESVESYFIVTSEMMTLAEHVARSEIWQEKAQQSMNQLVSLKSLQTLIQEARAIPVNFGELYEQMRKRAADGQTLVDKIYNTFTKVQKTRTQVG